MGATFFIGYPEGKDLHVTLNRKASNALEALFDEALQSNYPDIHEKIMEVLVLDQISFTELSNADFNLAVEKIRNCIHSRTEETEWQSYQKRMWEEEMEPLIQQDVRYQKKS